MTPSSQHGLGPPELTLVQFDPRTFSCRVKDRARFAIEIGPQCRLTAEVVTYSDKDRGYSSEARVDPSTRCAIDLEGGRFAGIIEGGSFRMTRHSASLRATFRIDGWDGAPVPPGTVMKLDYDGEWVDGSASSVGRGEARTCF